MSMAARWCAAGQSFGLSFGNCQTASVFFFGETPWSVERDMLSVCFLGKEGGYSIDFYTDAQATCEPTVDNIHPA